MTRLRSRRRAEWALRWLKIAELHIDQTYQRSIESRAWRAAHQEDRGQFQVASLWNRAALRVWNRVDGARRATRHRGRKAGRDRRSAAIIIGAATTQEQAIIFVEANRDRVAVTPFALHHAMLAAGDPDAIELNTVCLKHRISIPRYPVLSDKLKPGETLALGTIKMLGRKYTPRIADAAIGAIAAAYRKKPGALRAAFFAGAAKALGDLVNPECARQADKIAAALDGRPRPWHKPKPRAFATAALRRHRGRLRGGHPQTIGSAGAVLPANRTQTHGRPLGQAQAAPQRRKPAPPRLPLPDGPSLATDPLPRPLGRCRGAYQPTRGRASGRILRFTSMIRTT